MSGTYVVAGKKGRARIDSSRIRLAWFARERTGLTNKRLS